MRLSERPAFGWQTEKCEYQITPYSEFISNAYIVTKEGLSKTDVNYHLLSSRYKKNQRIMRKQDNLAQLAGCIPLLSLVMGIIRVYTHVFGSSLKLVSNRKNHIFRGMLEIAQMGMLLITIDLVVTIYRNKASKNP